MTYLAILLAAIGGFAVGAVWYMSLGKQWMAAVGRTEEEIKADQNPLPFIIAALGALSAAVVMHHMFAASGITGVMRCLGYGAGIGAHRPRKLFDQNIIIALKSLSWLGD